VLSLGEHLGIDALDGAVVVSLIGLAAPSCCPICSLRRHVHSPAIRSPERWSWMFGGTARDLVEGAQRTPLSFPSCSLFILVCEELLDRPTDARLFVAEAWCLAGCAFICDMPGWSRSRSAH
jgi:hypothetical protein